MQRRAITSEQLKKAELELRQAKNRFSDLKAEAKNQQRREKRMLDSRRKILAGAWVLAEMQKNADFKTLAMAGLDRFLTRAIDRAVFPELVSQQESKNQNSILEQIKICVLFKAGYYPASGGCNGGLRSPCQAMWRSHIQLAIYH